MLARYVEETDSVIYDSVKGGMKEGIPEDCPLRKESVTVKYSAVLGGVIIVI